MANSVGATQYVVKNLTLPVYVETLQPLETYTTGLGNLPSIEEVRTTKEEHDLLARKVRRFLDCFTQVVDHWLFTFTDSLLQMITIAYALVLFRCPAILLENLIGQISIPFEK